MGYGTAGVDVELKLSGAWTSVGSSVLLAGGYKITIKVGTDDAAFSPQGNTCELTFKNTSRNFNPLDPAGIYYGILGRLTEIRVSAGGSTNYRFHGFITSYSPSWNQKGNFSVVTIRAASFSKSRVKDLSASYMYFRTLAQTGDNYPVAYWPCEDGTTATSLGSAIGGPPIGVVGTIAPASLPLTIGTTPGVTLDSTVATTLSAPVPQYTQGTLGENYVRLMLSIPAAGFAGTRTLVEMQTLGTFRRVIVQYATASSGTVSVLCYGVDGSLLLTTGSGTGVNGTCGVLYFRVAPNVGTPTSMDWTAYSYLGSGLNSTGTAATTSAGAFTNVTIAPDGNCLGMGLAHVTVGKGNGAFLSSTESNGFPGEEADARITRIMGYLGGSATIRDAGEKTEWMGLQDANTLVGVNQDSALTDGGMLSDAFTAQTTAEYASLRYLSTDTTVRWALDASSGHLSATTLPVLDDKDACTVATVTRPGGGKAQYSTNTAYAQAVYSKSLQMNAYSEARLMPAAEWLVAVGSALDGRVPSLSVSLAKNSSLRASWYAMRISDRVTVANHPDALSPIPLEYFVVGWTETIAWVTWTADLNVIPTTLYKTGSILNTVRGRLESDGAVAATAYTTTDTSIAVYPVGLTSVAAGFATSGATPFDLIVGTGERITVTTVAGSSPQTLTVTRSVNGIVKAIPSGATLTLAEPFIMARN